MVGVTVNVASWTILPVLDVTKEAISPEPIPGKTIGLDMEVLSFCQINVIQEVFPVKMAPG